MPIHVSVLSIIVLVCMFRKWLTQQQILNLITLKKLNTLLLYTY